MNGVPQQLFSQPSGERHLRSGAQLGFVDANECHLAQYSEQRVVHHTWPDRQESLPCADAVSMMHNTQFIDHPVRFGVHQASMGWSADQSRVEVQSLRPPGEPPPGVSNMGASAPVQSTWAANQPWHRPVFTSDAGLATLQTIQGQTLLRPTVLPAVPHALENPISQQQEGVRVVAGAVPQPVNPPTNFRVLSGQKTPNQQIPAQHHTYQPLQQNVLPVVHRVVDNRSAQWIPAIPSQVPLTVDASQHTEAVVLPTAQMRAFHAPAHQVHYRDAPFGQLPVLLNPDNQACQPQGHARDAEPPPLPGGIWARKFHEQDPARCHAQPLPVLGQQPAHYGANITDAVPDSVVSHPAQPPSLLSHSLFDGLDAGLADNSPVVAKKDKPQKIAQDKPPPGLSLKPSPRKCRGSSAVTASECQDAENTKIVPAKDCSPPAAQSSLPLQIPVDEETAALDSCNEEQPEEYQPCTAAASSGTPPQRLKLNGTDSPEPVAYYSRCVDQAGHNASHPAQSQMNIEKAMSPRSPRNRSPNASTAPPRSRSVTPSSSDSSRDSSLHTIDDVQEQHSAQSPPATRNQNEQRQQHPSDDPDMSEDEVATTRSHTHQGDVSEVESGEIIDSRPVPEQPAAPPGPIHFRIQAQEAQFRPRIEPLRTPLKSVFSRPTANQESPSPTTQPHPEPVATDPSAAAREQKLHNPDGSMSQAPKPLAPVQSDHVASQPWTKDRQAAEAEASLADTEARALLAASKFAGAAVRSAAARRAHRNTSVHALKSAASPAVADGRPHKHQKQPETDPSGAPRAAAPVTVPTITTDPASKGTKCTAAEAADVPEEHSSQIVDDLPPGRPSVDERSTRVTAQWGELHKSRSERSPERRGTHNGSSSRRSEPKRTKSGTEVSKGDNSPRKSRARSPAAETTSKIWEKNAKASQTPPVVDHSIQAKLPEAPVHSEEELDKQISADNEQQARKQPDSDLVVDQAQIQEPLNVENSRSTSLDSNADDAHPTGGSKSQREQCDALVTREPDALRADHQLTASAAAPPVDELDTSIPPDGGPQITDSKNDKANDIATSANTAADDDTMEQASALSDIRDSLRQQLKLRKQKSSTPNQPVDLSVTTPEAPFSRPVSTIPSQVIAVHPSPDDASPSSPRIQQSKQLIPTPNRKRGRAALEALESAGHNHPPRTRSPLSGAPQAIQPQALRGSSPEQDTDVEVQEILELQEEDAAKQPASEPDGPLRGISIAPEEGSTLSRAEEAGLVCLEFCQTGFCSLGEEHCNRVHDRELVVPCPAFASSGHCRRQDCLLQHKVVPRLMPMCIFEFKRQQHKIQSRTALELTSNLKGRLDDFLRGFCPLGDLCTLKHFTHRTLTDYFMRPQDYESLISAAERNRGANDAVNLRCELGTASASSILPCSNNVEDQVDPSAGTSHADALGGGFINADGRQTSKASRGQPSSQLVSNEVGDQEIGSGDPAEAVRAAAEYVRVTAPNGGPHIGGMSFPEWAFE